MISWDAHRNLIGRTWAADDHPAVILEEVAKFLDEKLGGTFIENYLRRIADQFEAKHDRKKVPRLTKKNAV
jgi:hypothetical protein